MQGLAHVTMRDHCPDASQVRAVRPPHSVAQRWLVGLAGGA
jgi:hypothetical protein